METVASLFGASQDPFSYGLQNGNSHSSPVLTKAVPRSPKKPRKNFLRKEITETVGFYGVYVY